MNRLRSKNRFERIKEEFLKTKNRELKNLGIRPGDYPVRIISNREALWRGLGKNIINYNILADERERVGEKKNILSRKQREKIEKDFDKYYEMSKKGQTKEVTKFLNKLPGWEGDIMAEAVREFVNLRVDYRKDPAIIVTPHHITPPNRTYVFFSGDIGLKAARAEAGHYVYRILSGKKKAGINPFLSNLFDLAFQFEYDRKIALKTEHKVAKVFLEKKILKKTKDPKIIKQALYNVAGKRFGFGEITGVGKAVEKEINRLLSAKR